MRIKKHWEGVTPSPLPQESPRRERLPEVKEAQKRPAADSGKENALDAVRRNHEHGGTGSRHTGKGQESWTQSHKAT
jgi:hypothetical protein